MITNVGRLLLHLRILKNAFEVIFWILRYLVDDQDILIYFLHQNFLYVQDISRPEFEPISSVSRPSGGRDNFSLKVPKFSRLWRTNFTRIKLGRRTWFCSGLEMTSFDPDIIEQYRAFRQSPGRFLRFNSSYLSCFPYREDACD